MATEILLAVDRTKHAITKYVDGRVVDQDRFDPKAKAARAKICHAFGMTDETLLGLIEQVRVAGAPVRVPLADPVADSKAGTYVIRGITQRADEGERVVAEPAALLTDHLPRVGVEQVIQWKGEDDLVCLDVDYHEHKAPPRDWLEAVVYTRLIPKPAAWHFSRHGGLHLFYKAIPPFKAADLAGAAALRFRLIDASAGLEFKTTVRGPGDQKVIHTPADDTGGTALGDWLDSTGAAADDDARDEWLAAEGMELGGRYDHTKCPIQPTPGYESKNGPVQVGEAGVYCHRCQGLGFSLGCRRPGFAPWAAILGAPSSGPLGHLVRNIAHWGHARWILTERYGVPEALGERAYKAALRAYHHGKPSADKIDMAFNRDNHTLSRVRDDWFNVSELKPISRDIEPVLATLPACCTVDPEKGVRPLPSRVNLFKWGGHDRTDMGYPSLEVIHGFKLAQRWLGQQTDLTQVTVPNPDLRHHPKYHPRYVLATARMDRETAWGIIEEVVPRIDRRLIQLALCAFGSAQETRAGMLPVVFVEGPSGAAKTSTLRVAAGIMGTQALDVVYDVDTTRMRQSLFEAAQRGPGVLLNELIKDTERAKGGKAKPKEALDWLLNTTATSMYRGLYKDATPFGRIPSLWVTEPSCPQELRDEKQLSRRIRHYRVTGNKDEWVKTIAKANLPQSDLHLIRRASDKVNNACNAIVSYVVDDFFEVPRSWDEQAEMLEVPRIDQSPNFVDHEPDLRYLFKLVCKAPPLEGRAARRHGEGFKKIVPNANEEEDELSSYYRYWADGTGSQFFTSRRLTEKDWGKILGVDADVRWDVRHDGVNLFARFTRGPLTKPHAVNEAIINPEELP